MEGHKLITTGENIDKQLFKILQKYFNNKSVAKFFKKSITPASSVKAKSAKSILKEKKDIAYSVKTNVQTDLIITFAEGKLPLEKFVKLLLHLGDHAISTGEFSTAVYLYEKVLSKLRTHKDLEVYVADSYRSLGEIFSRQAVWEISFSYIRRAIEIYARLGNRAGLADCENLLGTIYGDLGNIKEAQAHFEKAFSLLSSRTGNSLLVSKIKTNLGIVNNISGNYETALKHYKSALTYFESIKDTKRMAEVRHNLGMLYSKLHKYERAHKEFNRSISLSKKSVDLQTHGLSLIGKASLYAIQKEFSLSDDCARKALEVCHEIKDMLSIAEVYKIQGIIQRELCNYDNAATYLLTSLRINKELKSQLNKAEVELELGVLFKEIGKEVESKDYYRRALRYFKRIGDKEEVDKIKKLYQTT